MYIGDKGSMYRIHMTWKETELFSGRRSSSLGSGYLLLYPLNDPGLEGAIGTPHLVFCFGVTEKR